MGQQVIHTYANKKCKNYLLFENYINYEDVKCAIFLMYKESY